MEPADEVKRICYLPPLPLCELGTSEVPLRNAHPEHQGKMP